MAELTAKARKDLPKSDFALPGEKKYPIPDKAHARNAKARAEEEEHRGKLSRGQEAKVDRKADAKLRGKKK